MNIITDFKQNIQYIKGVGPNRVKLLNKLGVYTLEDLITYYPRDYEDRNKPKKIADTVDGEEVLIEAMVVSRMSEIRTRKKNMTIYKLIVRDDTDSMVLTWYNQRYLKTTFKLGETYHFFGKIEKKTGVTEMKTPVFDLEGKSKNTGKIIPIYPVTYGLSQNVIRQIIENGLKNIQEKIKETLPEYLLGEYKLMDLDEAIHQIHFPDSFEKFKIARSRLVFEELLTMQLMLLNLKNNGIAKKQGIAFDKNVKMSDVINSLPFKLTKAQLRVLEEIDNDMESSKVMNRLLQGDVGSRKNCYSYYCSI